MSSIFNSSRSLDAIAWLKYFASGVSTSTSLYRSLSLSCEIWLHLERQNILHRI